MLFLRNRPSFSADSRLYSFLPLCSRFLRLVFSYSNFTFLNIRPLRSTFLPGTLSIKSKRRPVHLTSLNYCSKFRLHPVTSYSSKILVANSPSLQAAANCRSKRTESETITPHLPPRPGCCILRLAHQRFAPLQLIFSEKNHLRLRCC